MRTFRERLPIDPVPALLAAADPAVRLVLRRDVLNQETGEVEAELCRAPERERLLAAIRVADAEGVIAVLDRLLRIGAGGEPRAQEVAARRCDVLDGRLAVHDPGRLGTALRVLCEFGHEDHAGIEACFAALATAARADGGWLGAEVVRGHLGQGFDVEPAIADPMLPSHVATTLAVADGFAASPRRRLGHVARRAAEFLLSRVGRGGPYPGEDAAAWSGRAAAGGHVDRYAVLEIVAELGFTPEDPRVAGLIGWVLPRQGSDGLWERDALLSVRVLHALKRLHEAHRAC